MAELEYIVCAWAVMWTAGCWAITIAEEERKDVDILLEKVTRLRPLLLSIDLIQIQSPAIDKL